MTNQTSKNDKKNWLDKVIEDAQKEVATWSDLKRELLEGEMNREHFQQNNTSYGNF